MTEASSFSDDRNACFVLEACCSRVTTSRNHSSASVSSRDRSRDGSLKGLLLREDRAEKLTEDSTENSDMLPMLRSESVEEVESALGLGGTEDAEEVLSPAVGSDCRTWSVETVCLL